MNRLFCATKKTTISYVAITTKEKDQYNFVRNNLRKEMAVQYSYILKVITQFFQDHNKHLRWSCEETLH